MTKCDEHLIPFEGSLDWDRFAEIVAKSSYELPIVLEVSNKGWDNKSYLGACLEAGNKITESILSFRKTKKKESIWAIS